MDEVLDQLTITVTPKINSSITNNIITECAETLKLVKSITSQYRHTNKEAPKEPSYFIPNLFKPLHNFIEQNQAWTNQQVQLEWTEVVAKEIIIQYTNTINDLLSSIKQTKSNGNKLSDDDKIRLQIYLDVQQLGNEVN